MNNIPLCRTLLPLFAAAIAILLPLDGALASTQPYISGHQINFATGNKYHQVTDVRIASPGRSIVAENGMTSLQEPLASYCTLSGGQKDRLNTKNAYLLHLTVQNDNCCYGPAPFARNSSLGTTECTETTGWCVFYSRFSTATSTDVEVWQYK